jgi:hypothetical protein
VAARCLGGRDKRLRRYGDYPIHDTGDTDANVSTCYQGVDAWVDFGILASFCSRLKLSSAIVLNFDDPILCCRSIDGRDR